MATHGAEAWPVARRLQVGGFLALCTLVGLNARYPYGAIGEATYMLAVVGAALVAMLGLQRHPKARQWRWVAFGVALSACAEIISWVYWGLLDRDTPEVSVADPLWLLSYVAIGFGIARILGLRGKRARYGDIDALIDMAGSAVVGLLAIWILTLGSTISDPSMSLLARLVTSAYPILDVALLTALVGGMLVVRRPNLATVLLCSGVICWLAADFGYLIVESTNIDVGIWVELGWMMGAGLLGLAVCEGRRLKAVSKVRAVDSAAGRVRLAIGLALLLVPAAFEISSFKRGQDASPWPLLLATAALAGLAFARCARLLRSKDQASAELDASERYYRTLATNSSDSVLVVSRTGEILRESATFARLASLREPIVGTDVTSLPTIIDPELLRDVLLKAAVVPGHLVAEELLVRHPELGERCFALRVMDMVHDENIGGVVVNMHDITERKHMEDVLRNQAFHDSLTGLANRALFRDRVGHVLEGRGSATGNTAVAFIDLDEFKYINDTLGHDTGDQLLKTVAERLLLAVRPGDTVARLGGDEFAVLMESSGTAADATHVAERILEILRHPIKIAGRSLLVSCSIGIACADERSDTSSLLRHADMAMYKAKSSGKARWALYDPSMGVASKERMNLEGDLHGALESGQFELLYQPIFTISSGRLSGFEALLRWRHPTLGTIKPDRFIPLLEGNGHIVEVGAWVLERACRTAADWSGAQQHLELSMAVNVSSVQLASPRFVGVVEQVLTATGIDPARLVLEITETSLVNDPATAAARLEELHVLGVKLAIDDFGTGYSSLSYLRQFPTDILKIDSSFIQTIEPDRPMPALVKGILDLARTLGIETVAEGIEEAHQLSKLRGAKCGKGQGHFFAEPLSLGDARQLLMQQTDWRDGRPMGLPAPSPPAVRSSG